MVKSSNIRKTAKQLCAVLPVIAACQAGAARADECPSLDDLVKQVFVQHASAPSFDTKTAVRTWLCEGQSELFLSQQTVLPVGASDPAWIGLFAAVNGSTPMSSTPSGAGGAQAVTKFRANNCASPVKNQLVHALGRAATAQQFEAWHACDAAKTAKENSVSNNWDMDLSCAGFEGTNGFTFSVRAFDSKLWGVNQPLTDLKFELDNLQVPADSDYTTATIATGQNKDFVFKVVDPDRDASITMGGTLDAPGGPYYYYCNADFSAAMSRSLPYGLPPEAQCTDGTTRKGVAACPGGKLAQACLDGSWLDTIKCESPQAFSDRNWQVMFPFAPQGVHRVSDASASYWDMQSQLTVREGQSDVTFNVFLEERACPAWRSMIDGGTPLNGDRGQKIRAVVTPTSRSSSASFFFQRPGTDTCLDLQFVPTLRFKIDLNNGGQVAKTLTSIAATMNSF